MEFRTMDKVQKPSSNECRICHILMSKIAVLFLINSRFEVFTAVTMKNTSYGILHHVAIVKTDVSEERSASTIRVTRICELGTISATTSNRRTLR
jgi:hypothetical protein